MKRHLQAELVQKEAALRAAAESLETERHRALELETALAQTAQEFAIARDDVENSRMEVGRLVAETEQLEEQLAGAQARARARAEEADRSHIRASRLEQSCAPQAIGSRGSIRSGGGSCGPNRKEPTARRRD